MFVLFTGNLNWRQALTFISRGQNYADLFGRSPLPALLVEDVGKVKVMGGEGYDHDPVFEILATGALEPFRAENCRHADGYAIHSASLPQADKASPVKGKFDVFFVNPDGPQAHLRNTVQKNWGNPNAVWTFGRDLPLPAANVNSVSAVGYKAGLEPDPVKADTKKQAALAVKVAAKAESDGK